MLNTVYVFSLLSACKIIKESRGNDKRQHTTPNLYPRIQPEFGNKHVLNITWESSVLRGKSKLSVGRTETYSPNTEHFSAFNN